MTQSTRDPREDAAFRLMLRCLVAVFIVGLLLLFFGSQLWAAPRPAQWSLAGVASWAQPLTASGTALPAVGSYTAGDLFAVYDPASWTIFRLSTGSEWIQLVASGTGGTGSGVTAHSELDELAFADSGHTGFASESAVDAVDAALATVAADLSAHAADETDPHGDHPTYTDGLTLGAGTATGTIANIGTATVQISSYTRIVPETATPTGALDGTIWYDENTKKFRGMADGTWVDLH